MLERFAASPFGQKLQNAKTTRKEVPFILPLQETLIEGAIDRLYQDPDGSWAVLDYKTDDVDKAAVPTRAKDYETQIKLYGSACLQILGSSKIRLELYFLAPEYLHCEPFTNKDSAIFLANLQERFNSPNALHLSPPR